LDVFVLQRHFFLQTLTLKAKIQIVLFQFVKTATLLFGKVAWRRYLGEVGQFYRTLWLIYPRHRISISMKIGQVL